MKLRKAYYKLVDLSIVLAIVLFGAGLYMLDYSLTPSHRGKNEKESHTYIKENYPQIVPWLDSLQLHKALRDTFIVNCKGIRLHAYYAEAPQPTRKTAVILHGYTDNAIRMLMIGYLYNHDLGYNILLPDLQYHGQSGGKAMQMGWKDRWDVLKWINVSRSLFGGKADSSAIVVHGISMGAATAMSVSGETLPFNIKCFVEDCGYTSVWEEFSGELKNQFHLPEFPILYVADFLCHVKYGWGFKDASPIRQIAKCQLPMLFIHGDKDTFVPTQMVYRLYETKPGEKELWVVPGVGHAQSYKEFPEEYTRTVSSFVNQYMDP